MPGEFELINTYFKRKTRHHAGVVLGIGDDAALCQIPAGYELALAVDTLVENVHFVPATLPQHIAYKALAVNLSDMAAMGAEPAWFTLSLSLPQAREAWLQAFAGGLFEAADAFRVDLIGGDTTRAECLSVSVQIGGFVPPGQALRRSGAQPGDLIYVSGTLGDAALGLLSIQDKIRLPDANKVWAESRHHRPCPRVATGLALRGLASAAIDVSDGLLADLNHILQAGGALGAKLDTDALPLSPACAALPPSQAKALALSGGDDYELCFTLPAARKPLLPPAIAGVPHTCIGTVEKQGGIRCLDRTGQEQALAIKGFRHF